MNRPPSLEQHVDQLTERMARLEATANRLECHLEQLAVAIGQACRASILTTHAGQSLADRLNQLAAAADRIRDHRP